MEWLGILLASAIDNEIMTPADVIKYATPEILAAHLPPDVMSQILAASLKAGTMTPEVILDVADTQILSHNVPVNILWASIQDPAQEAGELEDNPENRVMWVSTMLEEGLRLSIFDPPHIIEYATPDVMSTDLPRPLVSAILQAGLEDGSFNPDLVVDTLGPVNIALHLDYALLWKCISDPANAAFAVKRKDKDSPTAEYALLDDSVVEDFNAMLDDEMPEMEVLEEPVEDADDEEEIEELELDSEDIIEQVPDVESLKEMVAGTEDEDAEDAHGVDDEDAEEKSS